VVIIDNSMQVENWLHSFRKLDRAQEVVSKFPTNTNFFPIETYQ
jgi:acyl carrier protein phosphodiesterase